ncbi:putative DNA modification/repair radical SAM protein [Anaerobranca californiensis DSM 14826]|uniref:Putative DNA modification/repair radical SAM protein n=1 Tax=Anaerobranca californiensis DSM 14826 TaxID=1120989 RepID=A0A1M6NYU9_9FIRM|nr:putative DNA modification/repair radical SAM protein [Anaerobranca californiensis]SHK00802.1 putative DNA modification/repair radical SAM protein [Anaerobranca californiensis DSM 14826]
MDSYEKLIILGTAAKYDVCASTSTPNTKKFSPFGLGRTTVHGICHSFTPDGRCISLLKVLLTNYCQKDCLYCPNRKDRDIKRTSFYPEELAKVFIEFYQRNYVEGLFLSSGIKNDTDSTMDDLIKTVEILRYKYQYNGYIHLKILPGAKDEHIETACKLANRVSINCETPDEKFLNKLSLAKSYQKDILTPMATIKKYLHKYNITQTTQFIVGAAGEKDVDILNRVNNLYQNFKVKRAYFSAFSPIANTPLEKEKQTPLTRENRLYQSDFLLRLYGFKLEDLPFKNGYLPDDLDPKLAFALNNLHLFPIEINKAPIKELLKVPGIGPISAKRILTLRREFAITNPQMLKNLGVVLKRALPFLTFQGKCYGDIDSLVSKKTEPIQLSWDFLEGDKE